MMHYFETKPSINRYIDSIPLHWDEKRLKVNYIPESVQNELTFKRFAGYLQFAVDAYR
jgi:hypothetical protein